MSVGRINLTEMAEMAMEATGEVMKMTEDQTKQIMDYVAGTTRA